MTQPEKRKVLQFLSDKLKEHPSEMFAIEAAMDHFKLTQEEIEEVYPSYLKGEVAQ
jgi:hypothetical protein